LWGDFLSEECLICKAPLEYLENDQVMECEICHKKQYSKTRCVNGHFVCDDCHTRGMDKIISICLASKSKNPIEILEEMMSMPSCHMHGPEHHTMVGSALLTAYKNAGGDIDLEKALFEMQKRGKQVPGGACGFWGACGAGISTGMYLSIALKANPLAKESRGLSNQMTARALDAIGKNGGPRCCKRDSYLAIIEAVKFTKEKLNIEMDLNQPICSRSHLNNQCLQEECKFFGEKKKKVAFICLHNSCRSQIAEALGKHLAKDVFESYSAGSEVKAKINQDAVRLMKKLYGIDMEESQYPKLIADIPNPDIAISMGCKVTCPFIGREFDDDWGLEDPTGKSDQEFIRIIKEIEDRILKLREELS
jgi:protein-tyrosine-phosphatase